MLGTSHPQLADTPERSRLGDVLAGHAPSDARQSRAKVRRVEDEVLIRHAMRMTRRVARDLAVQREEMTIVIRAHAVDDLEHAVTERGSVGWRGGPRAGHQYGREHDQDDGCLGSGHPGVATPYRANAKESLTPMSLRDSS